MTRVSWIGFVAVALLGAGGCVDGEVREGTAKLRPGGPAIITPPISSELGSVISQAVAPYGRISEAERGLDHKLTEPQFAEATGEVTVESCAALSVGLEEACQTIRSGGLAEYCVGHATFFFAHDIPRCAARVYLYDDVDDNLDPVYAFDLTGEPVASGPPSCGNGHVDEDEDCDDGNFELWDGCDSSCKFEEFNGCEAVIEQYFAQAGIADVDMSTWAGPRSHLMVNPAHALRPVDQSLCHAAISIGDDACRELEQTMPFVGWCQSEGELTHVGGVAACAVRLRVQFGTPSPETGVFTTSLPGILAFTIR